jgi:hypothetical protein
MKTWNTTTTKTSDRRAHEFTLRDYSSHRQQLKGGGGGGGGGEEEEEEEEEFPESTVTGEETWVGHFTPQTKKLECNGNT